MISCGICLSLSDLTSLSMIIARSIHVAANNIISFFLVEPYSIVSVCVCVCVCVYSQTASLSIHQSMYTEVISSFLTWATAL